MLLRVGRTIGRHAAKVSATSNMVHRTGLVGLQRFMAMEQVVVPSLGDSVTDGQIVEFMKHEGDFVNEDDVVFVLETDKVSVDVRTPHQGTITKLLAGVDDTVNVGDSVVEIDTDGKQEEAATTKQEPATSSPPPAATPPVPPAAAATAAQVPTPKPATTGRTPMIWFRFGNKDQKNPPQVSLSSSLSESVQTVLQAIPGSLAIPPPRDGPFPQVPQRYKPQVFSEEAIELINMGGAI